jgi:hypothetical protein
MFAYAKSGDILTAVTLIIIGPKILFDSLLRICDNSFNTKRDTFFCLVDSILAKISNPFISLCYAFLSKNIEIYKTL